MCRNEKEYFWSVLSQVAEVCLEHYLFVSNSLVVLSGKKQAISLLELEKAFTHMFKALENAKKSDLEGFRKNVDRFAGHIERMLLDMYKFSFRFVIEELQKEAYLCDNLKLLVEARKILMKVRNLEVENIGASLSSEGEHSVLKKKAVLKEYKKALKELFALAGYD